MMTDTITEPAKPWERQPGESRHAFKAFTVYRDMEPRSLPEAARLYREYRRGDRRATGTRPASTSRIRAWCVTHSWVARALAWDAEQDRLVRERATKVRLEMADRQIKSAKAIQYKAIERLSRMDPDELRPADVLNFFIQGSKLERLAMGEPTETTETRTEVTADFRRTVAPLMDTLTLATEDELREILHLLQAIQDRDCGSKVDR